MSQIRITTQGPQGPRSVPLERSAQIGRAPDNDLVLLSSEVSWRHALVYQEGSHVLLRDLGSRNGTLVDGTPITGPVRLNDRSRIRIGDVDLFVRGVGSPTAPPLLIEEVGTGVQRPLCKPRFVIGPDADADLRLPDADRSITLLVTGNGEVWLGDGDEDRPLDMDEEVVFAEAAFVVRVADPTRVPTVEGGGVTYGYHLTATIDGPTGPVASLRDPDSGDRVQFSAETRAVLMYLLGRQVLRDRTSDRVPDEIGWIADDDLVVSVWGKTGRTEGLARLKTLVHRVRGGCREAGLDPWCIEKRRGFTRIRVATVDL